MHLTLVFCWIVLNNFNVCSEDGAQQYDTLTISLPCQEERAF